MATQEGNPLALVEELRLRANQAPVHKKHNTKVREMRTLSDTYLMTHIV